MAVEIQVFSGAESCWRYLVAWGRLLAEAVEKSDESCREAAAACWESVEQQVEALSETVFLPLFYLMEAFDLDRLERQCLTLSLLPEYDGELRGVYRELGFLKEESLSVEGALRLLFSERAGVAESLQLLSGDSFFVRSFFEDVGSLRPAGRISRFVFAGELEPGAGSGMELRNPVTAPEAGTFQAVAEHGAQMRDYLEVSGDGGIAFLLSGGKGSGRRTVAEWFCAAYEKPLLLADGERLLGETGNRFIHAVFREAVLQDAVLCFTGLEEVVRAAVEDREAERFLRNLVTDSLNLLPVVLLLGETPLSLNGGDWRLQNVELPALSFGESRALWESFFAQYAPDCDFDSGEYAGRFRFTPGQMIGAITEGLAIARWRRLAVMDKAALDEGCRRQIPCVMGEKARRVEADYEWEDLILPDFSKSLLQSACDQMRYRGQVYGEWGFNRKIQYGTGLSMLFCGPPGTGKTMAAQIVAKQLGMELYKVDLSQVVSKYVGETEKNLGMIFKEAEKSQVALFFDEADVLFSKRTEVKDAHDKYNNMEAAYLLQKVEEYAGVSILATNYLQNFDEAFKRRLKFIIDFPFPDAQYRLLLWKSVFPKEMPLGDLDWEFLAEKFELSGSSIKNIAVNAAFLAAGKVETVEMSQVLRALKRELFKSGKMLHREDFGEYYMLVEERG